MHIAATEQSQESNDNQINANTIVQQPGHDENENTGNETSGARQWL
jgi:hypothetical protein